MSKFYRTAIIYKLPRLDGIINIGDYGRYCKTRHHTQYQHDSRLRVMLFLNYQASRLVHYEWIKHSEQY